MNYINENFTMLKKNFPSFIAHQTTAVCEEYFLGFSVGTRRRGRVKCFFLIWFIAETLFMQRIAQNWPDTEVSRLNVKWNIAAEI